MTGPAVVLRGFGLAHRRRGGALVLLEGVDARLEAGSFYVMVGESGSGKSSLLRLWTGLESDREPRPRLRGSCVLLGREIARGGGYPASLRGDVAAILQDEGLLDELSPRANVELALRAHGRSAKLAPALLAQAGLQHPPAQVAQLSGGQRKRVAVARALASQPMLWICDEPTAGLDPTAAATMAQLLRHAHENADGMRTTVVITHDLDAFRSVADGIVVLDSSARSLRVVAPDAELASSGPRGEGAVGAADGMGAVELFDRAVLAIGAMARTAGEAVLRLPPAFPVLTGRSVVRFALEPLAFVCLACGVIGGLATFFALRNNPLQGAFQAQVLSGAGKVLIAVLVPLLAGFFVTARMAAGAAARFGTMQRTGQVHALRMMGIRPTDYLLTPSSWGFTLSMPLATAAAVVAASFASLLAAHLVAGIGVQAWAPAFFRSVDRIDAIYLVAKAVVSGFLVAVLTYYLGTGPKRSGADVGRAVNASIVLGMALVLAVHAIATFLQFA